MKPRAQHWLLLSLTGVLIADAIHIPRPKSISTYLSNPSYFAIPVPKSILASSFLLSCLQTLPSIPAGSKFHTRFSRFDADHSS